MSSAASDNVRPIIIKKVRKVVGGGHHGGAWKVAYADFVTAMMAFFMLLWLISSPDKEKLKGLAEYFSPAPPSAPSTTGQTMGSSMTTSPGGHTLRMMSDSRDGRGEPSLLASSPGVARGGSADVPDAALRLKAEELKLAIDSTRQDQSSNVRVETEGDTIRISLSDNDAHAMFVSGGATLNPWGAALIRRATAAVAPSELTVSIEGHTDGNGAGDAANWRLSADRAMAARSAMTAAGLDAKRIVGVVALADTRPVYPDQPTRAENRRITIVLHSNGKPLPADASFRF